MTTIEIKHRWTNDVLFTTEVDDDDAFPIRTAVDRAHLRRADLSGAYLRNANLTDANLTRAILTDAILTGADLTGAFLTETDLSGADLTETDLTDAILTGADLSGSDLTRAHLSGAHLSGANLTRVRDDFRAVLATAPGEVAGLLTKLRVGEVDGSQYEGECACLVGTIANLRGVQYRGIPGLTPNSSRPSERWFLAIRRGTTPDNSQVAAITEGWLCEWQAERGEVA